MRSRALLCVAMAMVCAAVAPVGCGGEAVPAIGDPCVPQHEANPEFAGYSPQESTIETGSTDCATGVCVVEGFRGRLGCPYGQSEAALSLPADDPARCRVQTGERAGEPVVVPVEPQLAGRRPADAAYCTCRCDGSDPNVDYCECPSGYACALELFDLPGGNRPDAGSYCVRDVDPRDLQGPSCQAGAAPGSPGACDGSRSNP